MSEAQPPFKSPGQPQLTITGRAKLENDPLEPALEDALSTEEKPAPEADLRPTKIGPYEVHPYANWFPMMTGDQLKDFLKDIKEHEQQSPVVLLEGKILDGRNRALAAHQLGKELKTVDFEELGTGQEPLDYVISANLHRRHLSDHQRVKLAAQLAQVLAQEKAKESGTRVPSHSGPPVQSGTAVPLSGRRNESPAAIAAARTGVPKRSINRELAREAAQLGYREQISERLKGHPKLQEFFAKLDQGEILTGPGDLKLFAALPSVRMQQLLTHVLGTATFRTAQALEEEAAQSSKNKESADSQPKRSPDELQVIERILRLCCGHGDTEGEASLRRALEKVPSSDLLDWNREPDENIPKVMRLTGGDFKKGVRRALRFLRDPIDDQTRFGDFKNLCNASANGSFQFAQGAFYSSIIRFDREQIERRFRDLLRGTEHYPALEKALAQNSISEAKLKALHSMPDAELRHFIVCALYAVPPEAETKIQLRESVK